MHCRVDLLVPRLTLPSLFSAALSSNRWLLHQRAKLKPKKEDVDLFHSTSQTLCLS